MDFIVGTAGHIDHGKTALVRALTGVDADRLPEEKQRGITIDLGFAELDLGDVRFGFVDVPGHERFVKNMLAGAHGIDLVLLVVAADEGVMPQTREHFDICRLLAVKSGMIVVTKIDLVDDEFLDLVKLDVAETIKNSFLENAPLVSVSAKTGVGIEDLKQTLRQISQKIPPRKNETVTRLPIDRAFSVKGFGTVVTGTLVSGEINEMQETMEILPAGQKVRVRGLQTYGKTVPAAFAGQRTAVNLAGVDVSDVKRGDVLAPRGALQPAQIVSVEIEVLPDATKSLKSRQKVRIHHGTAEVLARVQILNESGEIKTGKKDLAQLRFEKPLVAIPGEHFIVRAVSPQQTIAGGKILDAWAAKYRRKDLAAVHDRLEKLLAAQNGDDKQTQLQLFLETAGERGANKTELQARTGWQDLVLQTTIEQLLKEKLIVRAENIFVSRKAFQNLSSKTLATIKMYHQLEPLARGIARETLREKVFAKLAPEVFRAVLLELEQTSQIAVEKDVVRHFSYNLAPQNLAVNDKTLLEKIEKIYAAAKLEVPTLENVLTQAVAGTKTTKEQARKILRLLVDNGELVNVTPEFYFKPTEIDGLIQKMRDFVRQNKTDQTIDVAEFKDLASISRKYAIPLLEYFDREKITRRVGHKRIVL